MTIRIVDNKKIDMTDEEYTMYRKIVDSYTTATNKGEDLFRELFATDDNGIILYLIPPSKYRTSFEIFFFLMSVFQHQHIRIMYQEFNSLKAQILNKLSELEKDKNE